MVVRVDEAGRDQAAAEVLEVLRKRRGAPADLATKPSSTRIQALSISVPASSIVTT